MTTERRKDPRVPVRIETEVKFTSWHIYSLIYILNISKGGMNIELAEEPPMGAKLDVKLVAPDGQSLFLSADVRHARRNGGRWSVGVEFENLDALTRDAIEQTIRAHGGMLAASGLTPRNKP
jgi:hypothetical protein